tara:strand:+ start:507 stop:752 length:246 start_codon:yes stop_codon:yes gene_type:complete
MLSPLSAGPILMTSISTALGMLPIATGRGAGGERRTPMGIVIIGGVLISTLLTLVVIPVFYTFWDDLMQWTLRVVLQLRET